MAFNDVSSVISITTFGKFLNMSIYISNQAYLYTSLIKFEPVKLSKSGDISLLVFKYLRKL